MDMFIDINRRNGLSFIKKGGKLMQAYCVKCRAKKEMKDAKAITMKNGRPATQGVCPDMQDQNVQDRQGLGLLWHRQ